MTRFQLCVGCGNEKPHTARYFYRCKTGKYGLRIKCKECVRADVAENRRLKAEYYRDYVRRRNRDPRWREYIRAWKQSARGRESARLTRRFYAGFKALELRA